MCAFPAVVLTSCGTDTSGAAAGTTPEQHLADGATVTAGLNHMISTASELEAAVAVGAKVDDAQAQLEVDWQQVEGTVRQNEPDVYLHVEDALAGFGSAARDGNAPETTRFAVDLASAIRGYLVDHP
ncbi:MAG: hypothetical protein JWN99_2384 [Ilumatobacteraceae bacterium]|nr:hypothetical protein [Ilumatobacteraceae bacterium]